MKTIVVHAFGDPEVMKLEDTADPKPDRGQLVVAIKAIGINPVDTYKRAGKYGVLPKLPYTPGTDAAGIVERVGADVPEFSVGDRVYVNASLSGTYAEKTLCEAKSVHQLPENISFEQGAALGVPYATAYRALVVRGNAKAGESLLVHGASGGVGIAAVQLARAAGLSVFGTASSEEGRTIVRESGAIHALDHKREGYLDELKTLTHGKGVDLILEMMANVNLSKDLGALAKNGRVVVIGSRGKVEIDPRDGMGKDADIRAMTLMNADDEELRGIHAALIAGLELGTLKPIIGKKILLAEAARAHREIIDSHAEGKIVLIP
jgi:NADPH2:quinone reductase